MPKAIKTIIILSIIFLNSCVFLTENTLGQTIGDDSFINRFPQNQKSIIILKLNGKKGDKIYLCEQKNIVAGDIKSCQPIYISSQYHILMLKPSLYCLIAPPKNQPIFSTHKIVEQEKHLAILEVKAGEVIYVGDVFYKQEAKQTNGYQENVVEVLSRQLTILDNFELVQKLLSGKNSKQTQKLFANQPFEINHLIKEYPNLQNRFKKKLLRAS
jgi:hypothetical protein